MLSSDAPVPHKPSPKKVDYLRDYLSEIGRIPRLSPTQEIILGKSAKDLAYLENVRSELTVQLERPPFLEEWAKTVKITVPELEGRLSKGRQAKDMMVKSNLRLVVSIAKKYQKHNLDILDLIQEGALGLSRACEKYDPDRGYRFSTYAYWWIRQAVTRAIAINGRTIRLPIHAHEKLNKIKKTQRDLSQRLGHTPSISEIANEMGWNPETIRGLMEDSRCTRPVSLSLRIGHHENGELEQHIEDKDTPLPIDHVEDLHIKTQLTKALTDIPPNQKEILTLRYGLRSGEKMSHKKIGDRFNLSLDQVRRMEKEALKKLKGHFGNYLTS